MADTKVSDMTALTGANTASGDLLPIIDVSETGAARNKKITRDELAIALNAQARVQKVWVTTTETWANRNSTAYVNSTDLTLTLPIGTYDVEWRGIASDSAVASAGAKLKHNFTGAGTATVSGLAATGNQVAADPPNYASSLGLIAGTVGTSGEWAVANVGQDIVRKFKLVVTGDSVVMTIQIGQVSANLSNLKLYYGSYLQATRID